MSKTWTPEQYVSVIFLMKSRLSQEGCGRPSGSRRNIKQPFDITSTIFDEMTKVRIGTLEKI